MATNVERNPDGSGAGVTLREALQDILDVDYGTCAEESWPEWPACDTREPTGHTVLCRIRKRSAYGDCGDFHRGFWLVGGNGAAFDDEPADFDEIVIHNGGWITTLTGSKGTFGGNARIEADDDRLAIDLAGDGEPHLIRAGQHEDALWGDRRVAGCRGDRISRSVGWRRSVAQIPDEAMQARRRLQ